MVNMKDDKGNFPVADMMGHSYVRRMTAKEKERASVAEEQSEGWRLEGRQKGYLKESRRLINEDRKREQSQTSEKVLIIRAEMFSYDGCPSQLNARRMTAEQGR
jgi:hypothetical protein